MFNKFLSKFLSHEEGQGLVEYALILVLVAIVVIAILLVLGPAVGDVFCRVANGLQPGICGELSIVSGPNASGTGVPGKADVSVTVVVANPATVTFTAGSKAVSKTCTSSSPCSITVTDTSSSGAFKVATSTGAEISGTY